MFTGLNNFLFRLLSGLNLEIVFFTKTFLPEPKLKPGVLGALCAGTDRPGVLPGRTKPCCLDWTASSSEDDNELLECGLCRVLGSLLGTGWFSVPFGLSFDDTVFLILTGSFDSLEGIFLTSLKALRSSVGCELWCGNGSKSKNISVKLF